ncbi:Lrp/AsnC family transcriptional regulator [Saprospiraceae bacterium]|nr:Lrp/AsnC family transcriptional regulator [Saprospiraceae bacterium]
MMDEIDRGILMQLQLDAKQNTKEIAAKVGLTATPTYERIKKLESQNVIEAYVAILDRSKVGKNLVAFCQVTLLKHQKELIESFQYQVSCMPEILECHHVSGNFDFLLKVAADDIKGFHEFVNGKLSVLEEISTIHSSFVMNSVKDSTVYDLIS